MEYKIKENSFIAKRAARIMKARQLAIVVGKTIHLHNTSREEFLKNERWLKHELVHIRQFQQHGFFRFIILYLWECRRAGYWNNKYEVEARAGEHS